MFESIKCPSCGANIETDASVAFASCQYCGTSIFNQAEADKRTIDKDAKPEVKNLLARADAFELDGDIENARTYYNRVLDIDATNEEAIAGDRRSRGIVDFDNVSVSLDEHSWSSSVYIAIDDGEAILLNVGESILLSCDVGTHYVTYFTMLLPESVNKFVIRNAFDEKLIKIRMGIFGLSSSIFDV